SAPSRRTSLSRAKSRDQRRHSDDLWLHGCTSDDPSTALGINCKTYDLSQPAGRNPLAPGVVPELVVGALRALDVEIGVWDLLHRELELRRVVSELRRLVAEGDEAGDVGAERLGAGHEKVAVLAHLPDLLL